MLQGVLTTIRRYTLTNAVAEHCCTRVYFSKSMHAIAIIFEPSCAETEKKLSYFVLFSVARALYQVAETTKPRAAQITSRDAHACDVDGRL